MTAIDRDLEKLAGLAYKELERRFRNPKLRETLPATVIARVLEFCETQLAAEQAKQPKRLPEYAPGVIAVVTERGLPPDRIRQLLGMNGEPGERHVLEPVTQETKETGTHADTPDPQQARTGPDAP